MRRKLTAQPGAATTNRRFVTAWIFYDVALHGYGLMIPGVAYAIYFTSFVATALLTNVGRGDIAAGVAIFVVAQVAATIGSLYNSYLPLIVAPQSAARVSGLAWGLSYLGGIACFVLCLPFTRGGIAAGDNFANAFLVSAVFLLLIGLPAVGTLTSASPTPADSGLGTQYRRIWATVRQWRENREVPKFLLAYCLVNDAIVTVRRWFRRSGCPNTSVSMRSSGVLQRRLARSSSAASAPRPAASAWPWLRWRSSSSPVESFSRGCISRAASNHDRALQGAWGSVSAASSDGSGRHSGESPR